MNRLALVVMVGCLPVLCLFPQEEIQMGTIVSFGDFHDLHFLNVDGEVFISWPDLLEALPGWFTVNDAGQVEITPELLTLLARGATPTDTSRSSQAQSSQVIESRIDGEFEGWDGETLFQLQNGQIWQQAEYAYQYAYRYSPRVTIVHTTRGWAMSVEGVSKSLLVRRIQ